MARKRNSARIVNSHLDQERAASMTDEGGAASIALEPTSPNDVMVPMDSSPRGARFNVLRANPWALAIGGLVLGTLGAVMIQRMSSRIEPALQPE